jgi:diamine N-acetyltransferase
MNTNEQLPQIRLRAMEPEDLELLYQIENDREVWNVGVTNVPYSRYVLRTYIAESSGALFELNVEFKILSIHSSRALI